MNTESAYWMALEHEWLCSNAIGNGKIDKMNVVIKFFHEKKMFIEDFFQLAETDWKNDFALTDGQIVELRKVKSAVPNYAFIAENLQNNGIEVIPVITADYSKTLKENLKKSAPLILYIKGNKQILQENSIAIVGSRDASNIALDFTDNIAKRASKEWKVVVSGFAKGVDKQALDSAIAYKGQNIIVLPQGILTFESGFKTYYKQITDGNVLVVSTFHPNAGWAKELAMARNPIIYGLAKDIYVAESKPSKNRQGKETRGGTYSGVMDGLKKGRKIFVRKPEESEKNDNYFLIQNGAISVDFDGNEVQAKEYEQKEMPILSVAEDTVSYNSFPDKIKQLLSKGKLTIKEIHKKLNFEKSEQILKNELEKFEFIEIRKENNKNYFSMKERKEQTLF